MTNAVQPHNQKAQSVWNAPGGRYDEISRSIADAIFERACGYFRRRGRLTAYPRRSWMNSTEHSHAAATTAS